MKLVNWGLLATPHNWVVVAFAMIFWAAIATLLAPTFANLGIGGPSNSKLQSGGIAS